MANNHGIDYGPDGLVDSLAAKSVAPIGVVGIGANATEAYAPWRTEVRGQRIAVLGASDVIDGALIPRWTATDTQAGIASAKGPDELRLVAAVIAARADSDTVVVDLHWGEEGTECPTPRQEELAQSLVDAGADIVVGSHSHRVETAGRLGGALVDYGLGNFVFYNERGTSGVTGVLAVTATGRDIDAYSWKPARIRGGIPNPPERACGRPGHRRLQPAPRLHQPHALDLRRRREGMAVSSRPSSRSTPNEFRANETKVGTARWRTRGPSSAPGCTSRRASPTSRPR